MNVNEFERRFQEIVDERGDLDTDPVIQQYVSECPECRQFLASWNKIEEGLEVFQVPELPGDFTDQVLAGAASQQTSWHRTAWIVAGLAVAAAVLIACVPLLQSILAPSQPTPGFHDLVENPLEGMVPDEETQPQAPQLTQAEIEQLLEQIPPWIPEIDTEAIPPVDEIAGLRPVATSFQVAYQTFRRTFPVGFGGLLKPEKRTGEKTGWRIGPRHGVS